MQQHHPSPNPQRENVWRHLGTWARVFAAFVGLCALTPLYILLFEDDKSPPWQQWVAVAIFTPVAAIIAWIVVTGRTTFGSGDSDRGSSDGPGPAA